MAHGGTYAYSDHRENGDTVQVLLEYPQGFLCSYATSLASGFGSGCYVLGRQGTLEFEKTWRLSGEGVKETKLTAAKPIGPKPGFTGDMDQIHVRDWLECARAGRRQTRCTAEHGYHHAVACILADQALHSGRRMVFDEKTRTVRAG